MKWLADTHALFWAVVDSRRLGFEARHIMLTAKSAEIGIPSAAIMELGRLIDAGTTDFAMRPTPSPRSSAAIPFSPSASTPPSKPPPEPPAWRSL